VSPSWFETAEFTFGAEAVTLARGQRLRRTQTAAQRFAVEPAARTDGAPPWRPALDRLAALLAAERPAAARVRLSGQFCRFALAPWSAGLTAEEERSLAAAVFRETYGEAARGWDVRADNLKRGEALVVCAVDAELIAGLTRTFEAAGWPLDSVEPRFAAALAAAPAGAGEAGACWHALLEPGWCSAALIEGDAFLSLCGVPVLEQPGAVAHALDNENVRLSRAVRTLRLLPGSAAAAADFPGWTVARAA
jgi:hypothetical protein